MRIRLDLMRFAKDFGRSMPASLSPIFFHIFQASSSSTSRKPILIIPSISNRLSFSILALYSSKFNVVFGLVSDSSLSLCYSIHIYGIG